MTAWRIACILFVMLATLLPACADDSSLSFVIAPPPVGYPLFEKGGHSLEAGGDAVYLGMPLQGSTMHAFGAMGFATYQLCLSDSLAVNGSGAILGMLGDKYNFLLTQVPVHANLVFKAFEAGATSYFLFGGAGGSVGLSSMTVGIPVAANVTDDTTFDTLTLTGSATFGGQCTITLGKFVLSPFGIYTYTAGSYSYSQISSMSYAYPSGSGSIHGYSTTVLGFDLLYKPLNVSLSSLFQNTDRYSLVSIALKWILSRG